MTNRNNSRIRQALGILFRHIFRRETFDMQVSNILLFWENQKVEAELQCCFSHFILQNGHLLLGFRLFIGQYFLSMKVVYLQQCQGPGQRTDGNNDSENSQRETPPAVQYFPYHYVPNLHDRLLSKNVAHFQLARLLFPQSDSRVLPGGEHCRHPTGGHGDCHRDKQRKGEQVEIQHPLIFALAGRPRPIAA